MSENQFTEITRTSWLQRIKSAFIGAFPLLWRNEGQSVARIKILDEGLRTVISVDTHEINSNHPYTRTN